MEEVTVCSKCGAPKSEHEFPRYQYKGVWKKRKYCVTCHNENGRLWRKKNRDTNLARNRKWNRENRKRSNARRSERRLTEPEFQIVENARSRINRAIYRQFKTFKSKRTLELLGCSLKQLKEHLEKQFKAGMTWDNYGYDGWHVDHIKPCAAFDLTTEENQKLCFHYTNLQPLWKNENLTKNSKWEPSTTQLENTQNSAPAA